MQAVELSRSSGEPLELARALCGLGQIERDLHSYETAKQHYAEAFVLYVEEGDTLRMAHAARHLGDIYLDEGNPNLAQSCLQEALQLYRDHESAPRLDLANAIRSMAILKEALGDRAEAKSLWEETQALYTAVKVKEGVAESGRRIAALSSD